ncbi:MAG: hypothetical protein K1X64_13375 [Myxococcaceae bacterium]|nr:hypothetical protein [Myxococcaceae bacterium]
MRILLVAALTFSTVAAAVVPLDGGSLAVVQVDINTGPGQHFDPHVSGDVAAYSSAPADEIRFYRFSTATDDAVPPAPGFRDILSDVSNNLIVFTRMSTTSAQDGVFVYDTVTGDLPTEIDPQPGSQRIGAAIGDSLVAYADFGLGTSGSGEIVAYNLLTSTQTRLTNDLAFDQNPAVSPLGNAVVWEKCATSLVNCDIWKAERTGAGWVSGPVADTVSPEANPDTDGTYIVYNGQRPGTQGQDIFFRTFTGAENRIELDGPQTNPSIAGGVIAFESTDVNTGFRDIFLYRIADNRLFRLTSSAFVDEVFEDISVLQPSGAVRIVWTRDDGIKQDVIGATITLPPPPMNPPGGGTCADRQFTIEASKTYCPPVTTDGSQTFNPAMRFALPSEIPVVEGNAANKQATLVIKRGSQEITCKYKGGAKTAHPKSASELAKAASYKFEKCVGDGKNLDPGDWVLANSVKLHIVQGDTQKSLTRASLVLTEVCGAVPAVPGHGNGQHNENTCNGNHDDDDDEHGQQGDDDGDHGNPHRKGSRSDDHRSGGWGHRDNGDHASNRQQLSTGEPTAEQFESGQVGCNSASGSSLFSLVVVGLAMGLWASPRRKVAAQAQRD